MDLRAERTLKQIAAEARRDFTLPIAKESKGPAVRCEGAGGASTLKVGSPGRHFTLKKN